MKRISLVSHYRIYSSHKCLPYEKLLDGLMDGLIDWVVRHNSPSDCHIKYEHAHATM